VPLQIQAVCGILRSFPDAESNPPRVPELYFDSGPDVAIIRSEKYSLGISEKCFAGEAWMIVGSLVSLDYARLLTDHKRRLFGMCAPSRESGPAPCGPLGIGTCSSGQMRTPPPVRPAL